MLGRDLKPSSWGGTQVDYAARVGEKVVLPVKLNELEGRTGTVSLLSVMREENVLVGWVDKGKSATGGCEWQRAGGS